MSSSRSIKDMPRHELVAVALDLGIERPERLDQDELYQQVSRATGRAGAPGGLGRGWFSVARHLVASVIEQGLNLPEAARVIREARSTPRQRPPLPTVTLAQIYLAQGLEQRARTVLEQVLAREPNNFKARSLMAQLQEAPEAEPSQPVGQRSEGPEVSVSNTIEAAPTPSERGAAARMGRSSAPPPADLPMPGVATLADGGTRDAVLLLRSLDATRVHVYWELSADTCAQLDAHPVRVRVGVFVPHPEGCRRREWSSRVESQRGAALLGAKGNRGDGRPARW